MRFGALTVTGNRYVSEGLLVPQVFERSDHIGLEIVPPKTELLLIVHFDRISKINNSIYNRTSLTTR